MSDIKNNKEFNNIYKNKGYFKIENFFSKEIIDSIKLDLDNIIKAKPNNINFYHDRNNLLRRIERFSKHSKIFKDINMKIKEFLKIIFNNEFYLFKDKCNFKPPLGEGFYPHYDGIFNWVDNNNLTRNGWHDYAKEFVNVLVVLDDFNIENGALEISQIHNQNFNELLENTKKNGTPDLNEKKSGECAFEKMLCNSGSIILFSSKCPHKSLKNNSKKSRGSLYYTYNPSEYGDHYERYFIDKINSKNPQSKSLSGEN